MRKQDDTIVRLCLPNAARSLGVLEYGNWRLPCCIGPAGIKVHKREGDGATPFGVWPLREIFYRPDRVSGPKTRLLVQPLKPDYGWCDAATDRNYNRLVRLPYPASAEPLWRDDEVYDIIVVLGYNDEPRIAGGGSAIFMHIARADMAPTAGCIALSRADLLRLLEAPEPPRWIDTRPARYRTRRGFM